MPDKLSGTLSQSGKLSGVLSTKNRLTGQLSMAVDTVFSDDYNKLREDISGKMDVPAGGSAGQVLTKTANGYEWEDPILLDAYVAGEVITFTDNR